MTISEADLILNKDRSVYHLNIHPADLAPLVILVGDPSRAQIVSKYFDRTEIKKYKREFVVHTGFLGKKRISVVGTGIGAPNIDIVLNELDALVNIDFDTRTIKEKLTRLRIIRLGTCGSLDATLPLDSFIISDFSIAMDGLLQTYQFNLNPAESKLHKLIQQHFQSAHLNSHLYCAQGNKQLIHHFTTFCKHGITLSCIGFYGPQSRYVRAPITQHNLIQQAQQFKSIFGNILNLEMETAAIYALGKILGHHCCSISVVLCNRPLQKFSKHPKKSIERMIQYALEKIETL